MTATIISRTTGPSRAPLMSEWQPLQWRDNWHCISRKENAQLTSNAEGNDGHTANCHLHILCRSRIIFGILVDCSNVMFIINHCTGTHMTWVLLYLDQFMLMIVKKPHLLHYKWQPCSLQHSYRPLPYQYLLHLQQQLLKGDFKNPNLNKIMTVNYDKCISAFT